MPSHFNTQPPISPGQPLADRYNDDSVIHTILTVLTIGRTHLLALSAIALVTVIYTWSLLTHLTEAVPGAPHEHDVAMMVWNMSWVKEALNTGADLFSTDTILLPHGADLRPHTYGVIQGIAIYPLMQVIGVTGALNLLVIFTLFLDGAVFYALFFVETRHMPASLIAAVCTMLGSPLLLQIGLARTSLASLWVMAGALIALRWLLERPTLKNCLVLALLLNVALFSDLQLLLFTLFWLIWYGCYRLLRDGRQIMTLRHGVGVIGSGVMLIVPFVLVFYPAFSTPAGFVQPRLGDMMIYSFRYWDYFTPPTMTLVYGYELFVMALLAVLILRWRGGYQAWLAGAVVLLILALGPYLQTPDGVTNIQLPFATLSTWPPLANFRTPYRLTLPALLGFGMTAALVLRWVLSGALPRQRRWVIGFTVFAISARLIFALIDDPLETQAYRHFSVYDRIGAMPDDFTLVEVPFGVRSGIDRIGSGGEILLYYQQFHGKSVLNGMVARLPRNVFQFYRSYPSLLFLAGERVNESQAELHRDFADVLAWSDAGYVLVHRELLDPTTAAEIETFLNAQPGLTREGVDSASVVIYHVEGKFASSPG